MKQIIDWLREQMQEEPKRLRKMKNQCISLTDSEVCAIEEKAYGFYMQCINEAEAKWESERATTESEIRAKAIDDFAEKMVIMMSGHRQDIERIAKQLKGE